MRALPLEPVPGSRWLNRLGWAGTLSAARRFSADAPTMLVIGKPSWLALDLLARLPQARSVYDAMDDFPAFYQGWSQAAMRRRERQVVARVTVLMVSATELAQRWQARRPDLRLVRNGLEPSALPVPVPGAARRPDPCGPRVLGYLGTVGAWFDWPWLIRLARAHPADIVRVIGPVHQPPPGALPANVQLLAPCPHDEAMRHLQAFDLGLIPFVANRLTASVDPIKYYEYRALGLPVLSTRFGEMAFRQNEPGVFLSAADDDLAAVAARALRETADAGERQAFIAANSWAARFDAANLLP
ncbi:MAG: glycosyl transferase [Burkholderiaceae bacterium]